MANRAERIHRSKMSTMLEMRRACERCHTALTEHGPATICSYECTFCVSCAGEMGSVCPNCGGELVRRPTRG